MKPKRLISLLVAVCMVVVMLPVSAFAADAVDVLEYTSGDFTYTLNDDGTAKIKKYNGNDTIVKIPENLDGYAVTAIGTQAFVNNTTLTDIEFPEGITLIEGQAFQGCTGITKLVFPKSIGDIQWAAFQNCTSLESVDFLEPSQNRAFEWYVFGGCTRLKSIHIPQSVEAVKWGAFAKCVNLKSIELPDGLKEIYDGAFGGSGLTSIVIPDGVQRLGNTVFKGCQYLTKVTIPNSIMKIGPGIFYEANTANLVINYKGTREQWSKIDIDYQNGGRDVGNNDFLKNNVDSFEYAHTVTFNNGEVATDQTVVVPYAETVTAPDVKVPGYRMAGYYVDSTYTKEFDFAQKITEDTTVYVKWEAIPATMTTDTEKVTCAIGEPATIDFTINANGEAGKPATVNLEFSNESALEKLRVGVGDQWKDLPTKNNKMEIAYLDAMSGQLEATFNKAGNYTLTVTLKTDAGTTVAKTINITVGEKAAEVVPATQLYDLTIKGADVTIKNGDEELKAEKNDKGELTAKVPENAEVTVTYTSQSDAVVFDQWTVTTDAKLDVDVKANPLTFKMPADGVTIEAMTKDASIEEEPNVLGTAAVIGTAAVGAAVLAWQGYQLGTELYLKATLPAGAAIPTNRAELALLVWNNAGKPEPVAVLPTDATETEKAIAWAVENDLLKAAKDNGEAYEDTDSVSRIDVIQCWNKATTN